MRPDWLLHFRHAWHHLEVATTLIANGDREEALRNIEDAYIDLRWAKRQLAAEIDRSERT